MNLMENVNCKFVLKDIKYPKIINFKIFIKLKEEIKCYEKNRRLFKIYS